MTRDWIGYAGGVNLYGYVGGRPTRFVDPFGLERTWGEYWYGWGYIIYEGGAGAVQGGANIVNAGQDIVGEAYNLGAYGVNGIAYLEEKAGILPPNSIRAPLYNTAD